MMAISQTSWILLGLLFVSDLTSSLEWSEDLQDGQRVYACARGSLLLPWNVSESLAEEGIEDIQWFFSGRSQEMVAMFTKMNFLPTAPFAHRVEHVGMGGLYMQHVQLSDAGNYTIEVNGFTPTGSFFSQRQTAMVDVIDDLWTTDGQLHVSEEVKAVWDNSDQEFHLALSCGTFNYLTYPNFEVEWTLPDGQRKNSTRYVDGSFQLLLTNPIKGGNYSCRIPLLSSAAACLNGNLSEPVQADIYVDSMEGRMTVLETQQRVLQTELQTENSRLSAKVEELTAADVTLQTENDRLSGHVEELTAELQSFINTTESQHVSFHVRLSHDINLYGNGAIIMTDVKNNQGGAYNTTTGKFTAPVNGTYFFAGTVKSSSNHYSMAQIVVEGDMLCSLDSNIIKGEIASCHGLVSLSPGQKVWMNSVYSSPYNYFVSPVTAFTGFLISFGV